MKIASLISAMGAMLGLGHTGSFAAPSTGSFHRGPKRHKQTSWYKQHGYRGGEKDWSEETRQLKRADARTRIFIELRKKYALPRRVLRAIARTRASREWRMA